MGTEGKIPFWEGQSYGIVPPGEKEMPNGKTKPHAPRLYSIASSRYGDEFDGKPHVLRGYPLQVHGPGLALHGRGQLGRQALRRRAPGDPEELPRPVPRGLRALPPILSGSEAPGRAPPAAGGIGGAFLSETLNLISRQSFRFGTLRAGHTAPNGTPPPRPGPGP